MIFGVYLALLCHACALWLNLSPFMQNENWGCLVVMRATGLVPREAALIAKWRLSRWSRDCPSFHPALPAWVSWGEGIEQDGLSLLLALGHEGGKSYSPCRDSRTSLEVLMMLELQVKQNRVPFYHDSFIRGWKIGHIDVSKYGGLWKFK